MRLAALFLLVLAACASQPAELTRAECQKVRAEADQVPELSTEQYRDLRACEERYGAGLK